MLKVLFLFTIFHLTLAQYWYGAAPPLSPQMMQYQTAQMRQPRVQYHVSQMHQPGMQFQGAQMHQPGMQFQGAQMHQPEMHYPSPPYPGMTVVQGPPKIEISRTVVEKTIPSNQAATLCVCTEASNCKITPKYRCQGSSVIVDGTATGDGVCCPESDIIC